MDPVPAREEGAARPRAAEKRPPGGRSAAARARGPGGAAQPAALPSEVPCRVLVHAENPPRRCRRRKIDQPLRRSLITTSTRSSSAPSGTSGLPVEHHRVVRRVGQPAVLDPVVVRMVVGPGVEVGADAVDGHLLHQVGVAEGAQRVVDGGERHRGAIAARGLVQALGRHVAVAAVADEQLGQRQPLPRRPQARAGQPGRRPRPRQDPIWRLARLHGPDMCLPARNNQIMRGISSPSRPRAPAVPARPLRPRARGW